MKLYQRIYTAYKKDGLRKIAKGCFDIIFPDCNLPDRTGFSFCVIICYQIFLPLYFPLSEFVNTGGTIHAETEFDNIYYISILRRMYGR